MMEKSRIKFFFFFIFRKFIFFFGSLESERISWVELFKHPLISLDENDIQEELDRINQDKDMDNLLKSVNINDFYLKRNKIVGIDKTQTNKAFNKNKNEKIPEKSAKDEEDQ